MKSIKAVLLSPVVRFFASVAASTVGPMLLVVVLSLVLAHTLPPAAMLFQSAPLSLLLGLLSAGAWCMLRKESVATAWYIASIFPAGLLFQAEYLADAMRFGFSHHIDGLLLLFVAAWGLAAGLGTAAAAHGLLNLAERQDGAKNKPNPDR